MKKIILASVLLGVGTAHADIIPRVLSSEYIATVQYNNASLSYSENAYANGPLADIANSMRQAPNAMQNALNGLLQQKASQQGAAFLRGSLSGNPQITIAPQTNGTALISTSGLSYTAITRFTGRKWGVISYECYNTLTLRNINTTAQYGTSTGQIISDKVGINADVSSNTECDSNLSWILPFVGDFIIGHITSRLDAGLVDGIKSSMNQIKDKLLFNREQNFISGLNKLVPADKVITLPDGRTFAIGQYLQNNIAYLVGNSQLSIRLGQGVQASPQIGGAPQTTTETGEVIDLSLNSPAFAFRVNMIERAQVKWSWVCSYQNPTKQCFPDY